MTNITIPKALLEQALETLEHYYSGEDGPSPALASIDALRAALSQGETAEPQPVAWMYDWTADGELVRDWISSDYEESHSPTNDCHNIRPLYSAPSPCPTCEALARTVMMDQVGKA